MLLDSTEIHQAMVVIDYSRIREHKGQLKGHFRVEGRDNAQSGLSHPPADPVVPLSYYAGRVHQRINEATVQSALFDQSQMKALCPERLNFSAL